MQTPDLIAVIPELILLVAACLILLVEPFLKPTRPPAGSTGRPSSPSRSSPGRSWSSSLAFARREPHGLQRHAGARTTGPCSSTCCSPSRGALTVLMSSSYLEAHGRHLGEYYALLLFAVIGMDLMAAARDFILFYVSLELMAISSYLLAAFFRYRVKSNESALKYFLTGSFASAMMLYGISLVYGLRAPPTTRPWGRSSASQTGRQAGHAACRLPGGRRPGLQGLGRCPSTCGPPTYTRARPPRWRPSSRWAPRRRPSRCHGRLHPGLPGAVEEWGVLFIVLAVVTMLVGQPLRPGADQREADAGLLLHRPRRLPARRRGGHGLERATPTRARACCIYLAAYTFMNLGAFGVLAYLKAQMPGEVRLLAQEFAGLGRRSPWAAVLLRCSCSRSPASRGRRGSSASSTCSAAWSGPACGGWR